MSTDSNTNQSTDVNPNVTYVGEFSPKLFERTMENLATWLEDQGILLEVTGDDQDPTE